MYCQRCYVRYVLRTVSTAAAAVILPFYAATLWVIASPYTYSQSFLKRTERIIVGGIYPAFVGPASLLTHTPAPSRITILHLRPQSMDPLKGSPAKNTKSTETADTTTYQVVGELTNKRSVVITGARAYVLSRELLLVESFGILIHATRTCRETPTPAPSQRTRFALSVTQRRSRRSSSA